MSKSRSRRTTDMPAPPSPQDTARATARRQARQVVDTLKEQGIAAGARVLELCCGYGWQACALARAGYQVTGVDIRSDPSVRKQWKARISEQSRLRLICADVRHLPLRTRFDAALLLGNSLSVFADNDDAVSLLRQTRRLVTPGGLLLLDNVCQHIWEEIAAGRYANGLSEDGLWQMVWLRGRNVFALRYGDQVRSNQARVRPGEPIYRAWSLDELDLLCRLTGWKLERPRHSQQLLLARPITTPL